MNACLSCSRGKTARAGADTKADAAYVGTTDHKPQAHSSMFVIHGILIAF